VFYSVGTYTNLWFRPEVQHAADLSDLFYAARTLVDRNGRRILWGWIREGRSEQAQRAAGWSGVLSLPRVVSLGADRRLRIAPAPELEVLRGKHHRFANLNVGPESENLLKGVQGDSLEVAAEFASAGGEECGLRVRCAPDGSEQTVICYNRAEGWLRVDREKSSRSSEAQRTLQEGRLELGADEPLKLRVFLDGSVVEVFANDRACLTTRIYPVRADSSGVGLFARGASVKLRALDTWEMRPVSKDRLTT
jgi:beta-fructofuranosidase